MENQSDPRLRSGSIQRNDGTDADPSTPEGTDSSRTTQESHGSDSHADAHRMAASDAGVSPEGMVDTDEEEATWRFEQAYPGLQAQGEFIRAYSDDRQQEFQPGSLSPSEFWDYIDGTYEADGHF